MHNGARIISGIFAVCFLFSLWFWFTGEKFIGAAFGAFEAVMWIVGMSFWYAGEKGTQVPRNDAGE